MAAIATFVFNPFQENTYVLYDNTGQCVVIDPGCFAAAEGEELINFINEKELTPVRLLNTHCHIDHILGNGLIHEKYGLKPEIHEKEVSVLESAPATSEFFGVEMRWASPGHHADFLKEGDTVTFGDGVELKVLFTPGHTPGEICFYNEKEGYIIGGDVLFYGSIGRTDLPGGDYDTLIKSIKEKLLPLPDETVVYSGHGPKTTIGHEREYNPFLRG